ncbi:hypothetical protein MLD38_011633 [Melastoma candidum]|uniref:Uncharacterized protein n=1 Tax=Melastoma candidum TaxID=119954 RepID=A0ACB9R3S8_9MYRT|nr:hypothetical protein MLD38_011633 [Melastoma candidum]
MPMSLEEYQVAQAYMVTKMQQQSRTETEGVDVLENRPFKDDQFGEGQYTSKVYRLQSKVPSWLTTFAPADALILEEEAWNAYPRCKTVIKCPYFTKFRLTVETIHTAENGQLENVHGLNKEQLASRQVEKIDIASSSTDYWSYVIGSNTTDFSSFKSARSGRGPLSDGWQSQCNPVMTAYKLVTVDAPYWGFGYRLEQAMLSGERALFIESHRNCFCWIDEWYGLSLQQVRELDQQNQASLNERKTIATSNNASDEQVPRHSVGKEGFYTERTQLPQPPGQPIQVDASIAN